MKRKNTLLAILAISLTFMCAGFAEAIDSQVANVPVTATVSAYALLTFGNAAITFPNTTPPTDMAANQNGATVTANFRATALGTLTVSVDQDLTGTNPANTIAMSNLKSTAATDGGGFFATTPGGVAWSSSAPVQLGSGASGSYSTTMSWALANSWNYKVDTYTAHATYTLSAP